MRIQINRAVLLLCLLAWQGNSLADESNKIQRERKDLVEQTHRKLDQVERTLEEWGRASVSEVVLVPEIESGGRFPLDYKVPTSNYVASARSARQGYAAAMLEKVLQSSTSLKLGNDVLGSEANRANLLQLRNTLRALQATNGPTGTNPITAPENQISLPAHTLSTTLESLDQVLSSSNFSPFMGLLGSNSQPSVSESEALKVGVSHKMVENALDFMANPRDLPGNQRAFFGIAQVSLSPGWRTQEGYIGEVQVSFGYAKKTTGFNRGTTVLNDTYEVERTKSPAVFAVFPFMEAQSFDLKNSYRNQTEMLAELAGIYGGMGYKAEAQQVLRKAKKLQHDLTTDTVLPLVIPSADHYSLTFRFDPEAMALVDPTSQKPQGGHRLKPASFPALIVVVCQNDELKEYGFLSAQVETRWIRAEQRHWIQRFGVDWWRYGHVKQSVLKNRERLRQAVELDEIEDILTQWHDRGDHIVEELRRRVRNLQPLALGRSIFSPLPSPVPKITAIAGDLQAGELIQNFNIYGSDLTTPRDGVVGQSTRVRIGGVPVHVGLAEQHQIVIGQSLNGLRALQSRLPITLALTNDAYVTLEVETMGGRATNTVLVKRWQQNSNLCERLAQSGREVRIHTTYPFSIPPDQTNRIQILGMNLTSAEFGTNVARVRIGRNDCAFEVRGNTIYAKVPPFPSAPFFGPKEEFVDVLVEGPCGTQLLPRAIKLDPQAEPAR